MPIAFLDSTVPLTLSGIKAQLVALCQANALPVTSFVPGDPTERWLDITPRLVFAVLGGIVSEAFRGFFLDLATDPGDPGNTAADQTPRAGFLSALGAGWYGTIRGGQTYAATTVTIENTGATSATFNPYDLTFTTESPEPAKSDGGRPTFRNTTAGTTTLSPGASVTLSVLADQIGTYGSVATANALVCVTQSFGELTVMVSGTAIGYQREEATLYRARCRRAAAKLSPGGPTEQYLYAMNTAADGTVLQRYDGSGPVNITSAYVSPASATGLVTMFVAGPTGGGSLLQSDLDSANANILGLPLGIITNPLGVLPDTVAFGPSTYGSSAAFPPGTPSLAAATDNAIAVTYTVKIKSTTTTGLPGGTVPAGTYTTSGSYSTAIAASLAVIFGAISTALSSDLIAAGINGKDFNGTLGAIYTADLVGDVRGAFAGLYDAALSAPSGSTTGIPLGHDAVLGTVAGTLTVV